MKQVNLKESLYEDRTQGEDIMVDDELVGKLVIDNSGNVIGKCLDIRDNEEDENVLIVEVNTAEKGKITIDVPMSTIQAIGKTIVLAVEIEGLVDDQEILSFDEEIETDDEVQAKLDQDMKETEEAHTHSKWIIYKSIKSDK